MAVLTAAATGSSRSNIVSQQQRERRRRYSQMQLQNGGGSGNNRRTLLRWILTNDGFVMIVALLGLYWFAASFFLAKRSLATTSSCDDAQELLRMLDLTQLQIERALGEQTTSTGINNSTITSRVAKRNGCWMDRRIDSLVILVVDALRFDFCLYNLPNSVGTRLEHLRREGGGDGNHNQTRLYRFVADPPTVTMQRLKALTTGGLPTFADISANFGGASVEEDNWVWQQTKVDVSKRGLSSTNKALMGFVGDDTWEDLYPSYFSRSYPYPSFNTRDLDTVDNGCLKHLPGLMDELLGTDAKNGDGDDDKDALEVAVVHFLGVDHVGHTYGPHNYHMDLKLKQMDDALSGVLDRLDADSSKCHATFIFGDHGMTEDGNHGGGTLEEISAALFVHVSPSCGELSHTGLLMRKLYDTSSSGALSSSWGVNAPYASIHQIDLVPTLSLMLGLPIPYANLGSAVPSIIPGLSQRETATALALNAAQVWRYLTVYSEIANPLPNMQQLHKHLQTAVSVFAEVLNDHDVTEQENGDSDERWEQSAALFQHFLAEALAFGQRVWTRFDSFGMAGGITVLALAGLIYAFRISESSRIGDKRRNGIEVHFSSSSLLPRDQYWEVGLAGLFLFFQCVLLTFSNSYILEEEDCAMFFLAALSIAVALRFQQDIRAPRVWWGSVLFIPVASRLSELFVSGHGLDSSLGVHFAHNTWVFLSSLVVLGCYRWHLFLKGIIKSKWHALADCSTLMCLAQSWWEKGIPNNPDRNGYLACRLALLLLFLGIPLSALQAILFVDINNNNLKKDKQQVDRSQQRESDMLTIIAKVLIAIMTVTGPSTAATLVLYTFQITVLACLSKLTIAAAHASGSHNHQPVIHSVVLAALLKFVTRHTFFATNHGCAFNRLQYSAAFIATKEFYFVTGGISLFLNTFGWEVVGFAWAILWSFNGDSMGRKMNLWRTYTCLQLLEALTSCISVSILRRSLMVFDIFAPRFLFSAIFTVLNGFCEFTLTLVSIL